MAKDIIRDSWEIEFFVEPGVYLNLPEKENL